MLVRKEKIWILRKVGEKRNEDGLSVPVWEKISEEPLWASVRDEGGTEFYTGAADFELSKIKVNISYREDISRKMRVIFHGKVYEIVRTYNGGYRRVSLDFDAERRSNEDGEIHL